ncbi:MAG: hypothetical protein EOM20_18060 [Spartobacteria bacterium]|nr:hypothetical protein [Spartobacteria bacterium]
MTHEAWGILKDRLKIKGHGDQLSARCPAHDDRRASLGLKLEPDGKILLHCRAHCKTDDVLSAVGLKMHDLMPDEPLNSKPQKQIVATYPYTDEAGGLLYEKVRYSPKGFVQRCPDPQHAGKYLYTLKGIRRVLYRLPDVLTAVQSGVPVFLVEGEKDADKLCEAGLVATCSVEGAAGPFRSDYIEALARADVILLIDEDRAGHLRAVDVAKALHGRAMRLRLVRLPGCAYQEKHGADVSDWLSNGHDTQEMRAIVDAAPDLDPATLPGMLEGLQGASTQDDRPANKTKADDGPLNYELREVRSGDQVSLVAVALPFDQVIEKIEALAQGKLFAVGPMAFVKPDVPGEPVQELKSASDLFAWLGVMNGQSMRWKNNLVGAMTKAEAFSQATARAESYRGIEAAPHWPPMENLFYNHPELPDPDHEALEKLLDRFAPETDYDRALILSMFLTSIWGGPEGQRPGFIITSRDGRGAGKTTLAEVLARLLNQEPIESSSKSDMEQLKTRLLSPAGLQSRVIVFDNEVGRVSSGELAGLITSRTISGRMLYFGEGRRPNNLLWVVTLNTPSLDSDLACRGIPISIRRPPQDGGWLPATLDLIEAKRWGIIAALIDLLKTETAPFEKTSRWGCWENQVLAKLGRGVDMDALRDLIRERQRAFDDEADEVELIRDGFTDAIRHNGYNVDDHSFFFKNSFVAEIYAHATGARCRKNTALRAIRELIRTGDLPELEALDTPHGTYGRGFIWVSANVYEDGLTLITSTGGHDE